jgi:hypothetical protein
LVNFPAIVNVAESCASARFPVGRRVPRPQNLEK